MKKHELRIGNYFVDTIGSSWCTPRSIQKVETINKEGVNEWHDMGTSGCCKFEDMMMIPLYVEWLIDKGFKKNDFFESYYNGADYCVVYRKLESDNIDGWFIQYDKESDAWCHTVNQNQLIYIHEFQNLWYDLTGEIF